jgi:hypothetical protein
VKDSALIDGNVAEALACAPDLHCPDLVGLDAVEPGVEEGHMDAGFEGFIEGADAVGGKEEDAFIVFENAEEDLKAPLEEMGEKE